MDELTWARLILAFAVMMAASISDWRTRTAGDGHWYLLGIGGSLLMGVQLWQEGAPWIYLTCLGLITLVFLDLLWDRPGIFEDGINPLPLVLYAATVAGYAYLSLEHFGEGRYWTMVAFPAHPAVLHTVPAGRDKGGADAKALIRPLPGVPDIPVAAGTAPAVPERPGGADVLFPCWCSSTGPY